ncbi:MAG: ABC transporter ATP-binding protein [Planctomycetota bacterium]|nr:MAG: ABC transporter ATP-binding protein [Planctomycetota bacterium]
MWLVLEEAEKQRPPETIKGPSPPRTEVVIEFQEVVKILSNRPILNGLSLKVYKGETLCIIGPSGTGKSTTLKHLVGLMRPDRGKVFVYGEDITEFTHKQILEMRKRFGVLFQFGALLNSMTVGQNVALPLVEHERLKRKEIERIVDEKLEMVEMLHAKHNYPSEISGGMKKRAGLARAIVRNPEIVLYDEPTSGLDPIMSNSINELIISMQNRLNITSIVVTHDMSSAYMIADRIALLHEGRVIQVGTPEEIRHTTNPVVRQFIEGRVRGPLSKKV